MEGRPNCDLMKEIVGNCANYFIFKFYRSQAHFYEKGNSSYLFMTSLIMLKKYHGIHKTLESIKKGLVLTT